MLKVLLEMTSRRYLSVLDLDRDGSGIDLDLKSSPFTENKDYIKDTYRKSINLQKNYKIPIIDDLNDVNITSYNTRYIKRPIIIVSPPASGKTTFLMKNCVPKLVDTDWLFLSIMKDRGYIVDMDLFSRDANYFKTITSIGEDILEDIFFDCRQQNYYIGYLSPPFISRLMDKGAIVLPVIIPYDKHVEYMKTRTSSIDSLVECRNQFENYISSRKMFTFSSIEKSIDTAKVAFRDLSRFNNIPNIYFYRVSKYFYIYQSDGFKHGVNLHIRNGFDTCTQYLQKYQHYMAYKNLLSTLDVRRTPDTILTTMKYMYDVIGSFIHVKIENNRPSFSMIINKDKDLSDDCRLISRVNKFHIYQLMIYRDQIIKFYTKLCNEHRIPDTNIVQNIGDYPCVRKGLRHPYKNRYKNKILYKPSNLLVFSFCGSKKYKDILLPTPDIVDFINNEGLYKDIVYNRDWSSKKSIVVFRGSLNKCTSIDDERLKSHILSLQYPNHLDCRIVGFSRHPLLFGDEKKITIYNIEGLPDFNNEKNFMSPSEQTNYKYILCIDGFVAPWRMIFLLHTKSVILKVESKWREYYYDELVPWVHYIPVKKDLSDLIDIVEWCRNNDSVCKKIAENAYDFALNMLNEKRVYEYAASLIQHYQIENSFDDVETTKLHSTNKDPITQPEYKVDKVIIKPQFDSSNVKVVLSNIVN